jgi:hypothetical protein
LLPDEYNTELDTVITLRFTTCIDEAVMFVAVKEPVRTIFPVFCVLVDTTVSMVSTPLPDLLINTLPSGTFMAN